MVDIRQYLKSSRQQFIASDINYLRRRLPKGPYEIIIRDISLRTRASAPIIPYLMLEFEVIFPIDFNGYIVHDFLSLKEDNLAYAVRKMDAMLSTYADCRIPDHIVDERELESFLREMLTGRRASILCTGGTVSKPTIDYLPLNDSLTIIPSAIDYTEIPDFNNNELSEIVCEFPAVNEHQLDNIYDEYYEKLERHMRERDQLDPGVNYDFDRNDYEYRQELGLGNLPEVDHRDDIQPPTSPYNNGYRCNCYEYEEAHDNEPEDEYNDLINYITESALYNRTSIDPLLQHIVSMLHNIEDPSVLARYESFINFFGFPTIKESGLLYARISPTSIYLLDNKLLVTFARYLLERDMNDFTDCLNTEILDYILDNKDRCHLLEDHIDILTGKRVLTSSDAKEA